MNGELRVKRPPRGTYHLFLLSCALVFAAAANSAARPPRKPRPTPVPSRTVPAATPTPSATPVNTDPELTPIHRFKLLFPGAAGVVNPVLYLSLGAGVALLLLTLALPPGSLWYTAARLLALAGLLAIVASIFLAVYVLFFMPVRTRELTRIKVPGSALVNLPAARDYAVLRASSELPPDLRFEVRPQSGGGGATVRTGEYGWSLLHMNNRQVGGFTIESPGVYEVVAGTSDERRTTAAVFVGPDYADEFAAGKWMAALALVAGIGLRLSARGAASVTSNKRHGERLARGLQFFHEQKGLSPHRMSRARMRVYDGALVLTRKFSETEIARGEVVRIERAQKTVATGRSYKPNTHLEGVRVHYQRAGTYRSVVFWTDSYKKQDQGHTDRILREKLSEAGYVVNS